MKLRAHRFPVQLTVTLTTPTGQQRATLADVHEKGARLRGALSLSPGTNVMLQLAQQNIAATVKWASRDRVGVLFDTALAPRVLQSVRGGGGHARRPTAHLHHGLAELR